MTSHLISSETPSHKMDEAESVSGPKSRANLEAAARALSTTREDSCPMGSSQPTDRRAHLCSPSGLAFSIIHHSYLCRG
eukprot:scaffold229711_cov32-Tisochrysis_lutea.AAC.1